MTTEKEFSTHPARPRDSALEPIPSVPSINSERWIGGGVVLLMFLSLISCILSQGSNIRVKTNVPGAVIRLDGETLPSGGETATQFMNIPHGDRQIVITHRDHQSISAFVHNGWFSNHDLRYQLQPAPITLTVNTAPRAQVLLDNLPLGYANDQGYFQQDVFVAGPHRVRVKLPGYMDFLDTVDLHSPQLPIRAYLTISAERRREIEENQQQVAQLLRLAQQQYTGRQYSNALASVDAALKLEPSNGEASGLRTRIVEIMKILK